MLMIFSFLMSFCNLQAAPLPPSSLCEIKGVDQKSTTRENSWQDCYKKAIKLAERNFSIITVELTGSSVEGGSAKTNMYVYLKWKYDDSSIPFMDTNGKVSKYTSKYETYPGPGDLRYFYDGRLFE